MRSFSQKPETTVAVDDELDFLSPLTAISPVDGRYGRQTAALRRTFSEYGLFKQRGTLPVASPFHCSCFLFIDFRSFFFAVHVEIQWLILMTQSGLIPGVKNLSSDALTVLNRMCSDFNLWDAQRIKEIETKTNHDMKAVEYFIKEKVSELDPQNCKKRKAGASLLSLLFSTAFTC